MKIRRSRPAPTSARANQLRGLFDIPEATEVAEEWDTEFHLHLDRPWNIGLITGPSGCGKSTIATECFDRAPDVQDLVFGRSPLESVIDSFPSDMSLRQVTELLSSVGFSSPPCWLKPYEVLSTGQQFRADIALALAVSIQDNTGIFICDEYTSVIDRTVAQIGSAAIAKTIRKHNLKFVAVTCHTDVEEWLQPDWIYLPAENKFSWRSLRPRPAINIEIIRCHTSAWPLFAPHHYLTSEIHNAAQCWIATIKREPVAFTSWLHFFGGGPPTKREHRTVCLPDYQGIGIGNALSATIASMWTALGYEAKSTTTHPGMIASRARSPVWKLIRQPGLHIGTDIVPHANTRLTAGFQFVGPPMRKFLAEALAP